MNALLCQTVFENTESVRRIEENSCYKQTVADSVVIDKRVHCCNKYKHSKVLCYALPKSNTSTSSSFYDAYKVHPISIPEN